jgi:ABC-2 type transport system permease protein
MNKTWLIIKREYLTRVQKKTFILSTILTPLLIVGLIAAVTFISVKNVDHEKIAVVDNTGIFKGNLENTKAITFDYPTNVDSGNYSSKGFSAILITPDSTSNRYQLFSKKQLGLIASDHVERQINQAIENHLLKTRYNIDNKSLEEIRKEAGTAKFETFVNEKNSEIKKSDSGLAYGIGYASGFLIYITLFIYGTMVMRGVMEEKTNRIAEVIVSSVKPFQLMLGKIIGIGAVGLTQFLMWIVLIIGLGAAASTFLSPETLQQAGEASQQMKSQQVQMASGAAAQFDQIKDVMSSVNWFLIIGCFLFYFLFGYLFYAALFAAVGSAVNEDPQDAQSLLLPVTMPIIIAIMLMMNAVVNPSSSMATWSSMIPFFSPIVMMGRIPFGVPGTVPYWQLIISMVMLVAGFLFTTWLSAKIYRTGILMYGKKVTWKEMIKWVFRKS